MNPNKDPVYDSDSDEPQTIHNNPAKPKKDGAEPSTDLRGAEESGERGLFNARGDEAEKSVSPRRLASAETKGGAPGSAGGFSFNPADKKGGGVNRVLKIAGKHKRGVGMGIGVGGGIACIIIFTFLALIPLKIEHIVKNLENRFFSSSQNAVDHETQRMFTRYMVNHVLPGYRGKCGTTIDKGCSATNLNGNNPVSRLYRTWSNAKLENKLAENYGIEFKYDTQSKNWYLKAPGTNPGGDNIGHDGEKLDGDFNKADRATMRAAIGDSLEGETKWKSVMYRYKVGRLLEEKYGLRRCIIFCGIRDPLNDKIDAQKKAAKLKLVQRVITPHTETLGTVMECLINSCDPTKVQPIEAQDGTTGELGGSPENPETDSKIREDNNSLADKFASATADKLLADYNLISEKGFQRYILVKVLEKVGLSQLSGQIADAVPIVGWVNRAATIITFINNAGPALKKLGYLANAGSAVSLYMMYRTYADEVHTGHVTPREVGSMVDSLGSGNSGPPSDPEKGGTAGAEGTPLYQNLIDNQPAANTAYNNLLPAKAYAASASQSNKSSDYTCQDGKPVPAGKLVCSEEVLGGGNEYLDSVHGALNTQPLSYITQLASAWHGILGGIFRTLGDIFGSVLNSIPGVSQLVSSVSTFISNIAQPFFTFLTDKLLPNPFGSNMSGGRTFDMMAAGADVSGNEYAHTGLGGKQLNPQQVADIYNQQQDEARQSFSHQSLFARMFNTDDQYSLVSKIAMSIPIGIQANARSGLASLLNPFGAISHGFGSILSSNANAAVTAQPDPFGVTQYGYTQDDLDKIGDPEVYWDAHCSNNASNAYMKNNSWNEAAAAYDANSPDDPSGMPINKTTNPCLLLKATVGSAGGLFDTNNLTADDLADQQSSGGSASPTSSVSGDAQDLAKQILNNSNIDLVGRYTTNDIQNTADGKPAYNNVKLDIGILQFLLDAAGHGKVYVSSITGAGSGHSSGSNHYTGHAVDLKCQGVGTQVELLNQTAAKYHGSNNGERCDRPNPYGYPPHDHYDFFNN